MRKSLFVSICFTSALIFALLSEMAFANASISLPTAQRSLTVYIPPPETVTETAPAPVADVEWMPISARLNQRMATRSGPSSLYTEELGTVPQSTEIVVFWQEDTGVSWAMVEYYSRNGKLYRAYTGMKRIDADGEVPELSAARQKAVIVPDIRPYYGPGAQYEPVPHTLRGGMIVEVCCKEREYALIEYLHPTETEKKFRAWVPVSALKELR